MKTVASRYVLEYPVSIFGGDTRQIVKSVNLSKTGVAIKIPPGLNLNIGETHKFQLHFGKQFTQRESVEFDAKVVWVQGTVCGLQLKNIPSNSQRIYYSLIEGYESLLGFTPFSF